MATNTALAGKTGFDGFATRGLRDLNEKIRLGLSWRRAYKSTFQELTRLSDRDLADLGMTRDDIATIASKAASETVGLS